ncbi:MAG: poly(R)-hydroxyalkanoic acid synthase subunit PhaE [Pseudomonadota bacterium]
MSNNDSFEKMMNAWSKGQKAFFESQKEAMRNFEEAFSQPGAEKPDEAAAAWNRFIEMWAPGWNANAFATNQKTDSFAAGRDAFLAMLDPANWTQYAPEQLRAILESIAQGPRFADLASPQIDAANAWRETLDYQKAAADMSRVLHAAWARTYERFSKTHSIEDLQSGDVNDALATWLKEANAELLETQRTKEFMEAQRNMLRASIEIKARQRKHAEEWCESYQMPTRTEIDDLTKTVYELRREVRELKQKLSSARNKS